MPTIANPKLRQLYAYVFGNAVRLWGTQNPRYFEGPRVAKAGAALLKAPYAGARSSVVAVPRDFNPARPRESCSRPSPRS